MVRVREVSESFVDGFDTVVVLVSEWYGRESTQPSHQDAKAIPVM